MSIKYEWDLSQFCVNMEAERDTEVLLVLLDYTHGYLIISSYQQNIDGLKMG